MTGSNSALSKGPSKSAENISNIENSSIFSLAESQITALAGYPRENVVAYSELESLEIAICQWPSKNRIGPKGFVMGMFVFALN